MKEKIRVYSWKCSECSARGKRWFHKWYGFKGSPFDSAGRHTNVCPNKEEILGQKRHPHENCPNHMVISKLLGK